jgi:regulatory protein YycI of two-component signal transduction system YycFG
MDWGRAKSILIVSFLCLNILLGYQLWVTRWEQAQSLSHSAGSIDETNKLLADKKIRLVPEVPKDAPKLKQITAHFPEAYRNPSTVTLSTPVNYVKLLNKTFLRDVLASSGADQADAYRLDSARSRNGVFVFNQIFEDMPLFDINLTLFAQKGQITGFKQSYVEVQSGGEQNAQKEQKVISAYTAIRSLAESYLKEGAVITDIRLGYHGQRFDSDTRPMLPFWRIMLADGEPYYVQAFNGEVEGPQTPNAAPAPATP